MVSGTIHDGGVCSAWRRESLASGVRRCRQRRLRRDRRRRGRGAVRRRSAKVAFVSNDSGGLDVDGTGAIDVTVSGFGVSGGVAHKDAARIHRLYRHRRRGDLHYASGSAGNTSGTLTVSSGGILVATIELTGTYSSGNFHISSGSAGTVEITDPAGTVVNGGSVEMGTARTTTP